MFISSDREYEKELKTRMNRQLKKRIIHYKNGETIVIKINRKINQG